MSLQKEHFHIKHQKNYYPAINLSLEDHKIKKNNVFLSNASVYFAFKFSIHKKKKKNVFVNVLWATSWKMSKQKFIK